MYPEIMVIPMREELTRIGVQELRNAADVEQFIKRPGVSLVVVNSVCGCAAGRMRPAVRMALESTVKPENIGTVFAGQDRDATEAARSHFGAYPPTSPSIVVMQDGKVLHMMQRSDIEHRDAHDIANELTRVFEKFCGVASR
ncbi:MAG TPA: BrxA/BrxB family bacilliredoxin [Terriglobales bacterium]|nr:BrxA/BrxB family bacilliredoxin [Terriglobales bacterium]